MPLSIWENIRDNQLPIGSEELEQYAAIGVAVSTNVEPSDENIVKNVIDDCNDEPKYICLIQAYLKLRKCRTFTQC